MKILNLYAGIGGNRKLWGNAHEITAIEQNAEIADIYKDLFPQDRVIITDAHAYLLEHLDEYDFIWTSPPCPTHSDIRRCGVHGGLYEIKYPEMSLYQEIILLKHFSKCDWVVENVKPYYEPLISPKVFLHRHLFWTNLSIPKIEIFDDRRHDAIKSSSVVYGFDLSRYKIKDKIRILRNCVNPELGLHILNQGLGLKTETLQMEFEL